MSLEAEPFLGVSCLQGLLMVPVLNREGFFNNANIFKELQMLCHYKFFVLFVALFDYTFE